MLGSSASLNSAREFSFLVLSSQPQVLLSGEQNPVAENGASFILALGSE
jgi:hypothetical protein